MQETWDVSALIDKGTRIHEARGMTMQHLGMELRHIANRAFIDFVTPEQRAWFRRDPRVHWLDPAADPRPQALDLWRG